MKKQTSSFTQSSRTRLIAYWITTGIIGLELGVGAIWDLAKIPFVTQAMEHLGYPSYFLLFMGLWKAPGVIVLLAPGFLRLKEWVYAGIVFVYTGATFSHGVMGDYKDMTGPLIFTGLTFASWVLRPTTRKLT
ncbi:MAG TPA: DoxX family protein [Cytophagaceae bacterium]|jgi:uncharacterized membrane protein YphA (DoxX/SURF4 family)|nr:DoxX family protein [Cytophagaceae bacterium]